MSSLPETLQGEGQMDVDVTADGVSSLDSKAAVVTKNLWDVPPEIFFVKILPLLDLKALMILSATCVDMRVKIHDYLNEHMKVMDIARYGSKISQYALESFLTKLECCRQLYLAGCKSSLSDGILEQVFRNNKSLHHIDLSDCISLSNHSLQTLAISASKLTHLSLQGCSRVSPEAVTNIALHCKFIIYLNLAGCWNVNDDTVYAISISCKG